jgi:hypothetical protein
MSYKAFCSNYGEHSTKSVRYRCWNKEAMEGMNGDMSAVWDSFAVDLETRLDRVNGVVAQAFRRACRVALSTRANEPGVARPMQILAAMLRRREDRTLYGIEEANENFQSDLSSLNTNVFSSIRTAFIGQLMENTYHAANIDYGIPAPIL